jgi:Flp pilus assembly protein TadG
MAAPDQQSWRRTHRQNRGERGAALVEFAILTPLLALIVFATIDIGRVWRVEEQLKNATREGANYAQYDPWAQSGNTHCSAPNTVDWHAQQEGGHTDFVVSASPSASALTSCPTTNPEATSGALAPFASGNNITITVTAPSFKLLTSVMSKIIPSLTPHASVTVKIQ